ncbi:holliday junction resolvase [Bacillus phage 010DV004]|nr:holliday junction resolvase [Bacillus phage 010DV004]QZA69377.1 holliday junction resolvase [Bacillus phage 010DV005]
MGKKSKTKGASYELKIAKLLTSWWGGGTFNRVPASGALHWGRDQRVAGDIVAPLEAYFPFVIECKKREEWTMDHILLDIGQPREWWEQVVSDARRVDRVPILIFSRNRAKDFIMIPYESSMYDKLNATEKTSMITTVSITNIRDEVQYFDVIVSTYDALTKVPISEVKEYAAAVDWDKYKDEYQ